MPPPFCALGVIPPASSWDWVSSAAGDDLKNNGDDDGGAFCDDWRWEPFDGVAAPELRSDLLDRGEDIVIDQKS